jgi:putative membrane protein
LPGASFVDQRARSCPGNPDKPLASCDGCPSTMHGLRIALVALVAIEHLYILILEMFLWNTPRGRRAFGTSEEFAASSKALAANQGLYNGFLAAGLLWSLSPTSVAFSTDLQLFFLACVLVAAIFGAATAKRSILFVQGVPAALALSVVLIDAFR